jgi:hypothetical protein
MPPRFHIRTLMLVVLASALALGVVAFIAGLARNWRAPGPARAPLSEIDHINRDRNLRGGVR